MSEHTKNFIDALAQGQNADAGEHFKSSLRDKVGDALDTQRTTIAQNWFNGANEDAETKPTSLEAGEQNFSDPKPFVTEPSAQTAEVIDTTGNKIDVSPEAAEPTAEIPVANETDGQ